MPGETLENSKLDGKCPRLLLKTFCGGAKKIKGLGGGEKKPCSVCVRSFQINSILSYHVNNSILIVPSLKFPIRLCSAPENGRPMKTNKADCCCPTAFQSVCHVFCMCALLSNSTGMHRQSTCTDTQLDLYKVLWFLTGSKDENEIRSAGLPGDDLNQKSKSDKSLVTNSLEWSSFYSSEIFTVSFQVLYLFNSVGNCQESRPLRAIGGK